MDLDCTFVAAVVKGGRDSVRRAIDRGVTEDYLAGPGLAAWKFVLDYLSQYHDVPDPAMVEGKTGVKVDTPPPGPAEFFIDEILNRRLHGEIGKRLLAVTAYFEARDPQAAYAEYEEGLRSLRKLGIATAKTIRLPSLGPDFLEYYDKLKAGHRGILTPWPTINDATLGFWPEDFVLYVARLGVGKTWALTILADYVWSVQQKRVLFATTEMAQIKILQRWIAVHFKYPYNDLRKGQLSAFAEQKMRDRLEEMKAAEGLYIIGGDFDFRIESLEAAIEESEPDVVFMDGAYLLKVEGAGRIEKAANSFDELKRVAKRNHVPLVASTQFNREVKDKLSSVGPEKIALSDAAGWNADLIFGLVRTEDMKRDKRMIQLPLKFREGEAVEIETWWDFDLMRFDELPKGQAAAAGGGPGGGAGGPGGAGGAGGQGGAGGAPAPDPDPYGTGLLFGSQDPDKDAVPF